MKNWRPRWTAPHIWNESRDGISFKNVPKGKYMLTLKRILKLETKDNDAPAKGEIRLVFYDKKEVTVK